KPEEPVETLTGQVAPDGTDPPELPDQEADPERHEQIAGVIVEFLPEIDRRWVSTISERVVVRDAVHKVMMQMIGHERIRRDGQAPHPEQRVSGDEARHRRMN